MIKKDQIVKSKNFCMAPWTTLHAWPSGEAFPCCVILPENNQNFLTANGMCNLTDTPIKEAWNTKLMKLLRLNMLDDNPTEVCKRCIEIENSGNSWSLRKSLNDKFAESHWHKVESTNVDGTHDDLEIIYWDIRFNNLCNMKCRSCSIQFSSQWYEDSVKQFFYTGKAFKGLPEKFWEEALPLLKNVEYVYFAGGEPLITEEHYKMLDFWINNNKLDISIDYTTNFSKIKLGNRYVFDYWNKFKNVKVGASLDASYKRAEYLRKGTNWNEIVWNRKLMIKECPNTKFYLTPTISIFNVLHFPDFHKEWLDEGLVDVYDININILTEPDYMRIQHLPIEIKRQIEKKWLSHLDYIDEFYVKPRGNDFKNTTFYTTFTSVINFLYNKNDNDDTIIKDFIHKTQWLDNLRQESWIDIFPELELLKKYEY